MTLPSSPEPFSSSVPKPPTPESWSPEFAAIAAEVRRLAQQSQQSVDETLALLRLLEALHREIRTTTFQRLLPTNRQALYALLREIEAEGGWPYISRMSLRSLFRSLPRADDSAES
ncbi:MAG: hypothetical protein ACO4CG_00815 [Prochlorothrix sp.]|nr:hypothetical protein [Prochlorothrix sp.]